MENGVYLPENLNFNWDSYPCPNFELWLATDSTFTQNFHAFTLPQSSHSIKNIGCGAVHLDFNSGRSGWPQQIHGAGIIPQG